MTESNKNIDFELLTKYLSGEASLEECEKVEIWRDTSEANRQSFEQIKNLWEETGRITQNGPANVNVDAAWSKIRDRINTNGHNVYTTGNKHIKSKIRPVFYYAIRVAAILILGVIVHTIYKNTISVVPDVQLSSKNEIKTDTLPDGSVISLNKNSQIEYIKELKTQSRIVSLSGEAYFQVAHYDHSNFIVKTNNATITVVGTSFYVNAYDSLPTIEVGVKEGEVLLNTSINNSTISLKANKKLAIHKSSGKPGPLKPYDPNVLFWKTHALTFQNTELGNVFQTLEKQYNIKIEVENDSILNCRLTAKFTGEQAEKIIDIISTNFNLHTEMTNNQFIILGKGCD